MTYRGANRARFAPQMRDMLRQVGQTATWRAFVSAAAGVAAAGQGETVYYTERTVTGFFGNRAVEQMLEHQTPAGMVAAGDLYMVGREQLGRRDELRWRGVVYRVDSDPIPASLEGYFITVFKRSE